ncbi:FtsK/SpoIIIE domain-containing protein [Frankia sp. Cas4]|uniref:FtsK/SpoIIIE domain-containing protein n=1 Tax=Frankia sp. Cas4 TaxID=3073927 RepID=UPI002AD4A9A8|nr:FtsK/SpoIIIE domain-containing protein [Frankia sp. Cas4]
MPVLRVSGSARRMRLWLRPSVWELLFKYGFRALWGWRREIALLTVLVLGHAWAAQLLGKTGAQVLLMLVGVLVAAVPRLRRGLLEILAVGRLRRRWAAACRACELMVYPDLTPRVRRVHRVPSGMELEVQVRAGQSVADVERHGPALAAALGARSLRLRADPRHAGRIDVLLVYREPLDRLITAAALPIDGHDIGAGGGHGGMGLDRLVVGVREDGKPWRLALRGSHVLIAGATGAGKGSVLWSTIRALAPAIHGGLVEVWAVDPKGGMELAFGEALFTRFATDIEGIADLLEDAVGMMRDRTGRLRGVTRLHVPAAGSPLIVVIIDEIASLTAYVTDREVKKRIAAALSLLLSQGRAPGVVVIGAVQDPRKEVLPFRDLFPVRVCLRMTEADQVDLVLGDGAHARGAHAEMIPPGLPGVGFVRVDGQPEPVRVRAGWQTDEEIRGVARDFPALGPGTTGDHDGDVDGMDTDGAERGVPARGGWVPTLPPAIGPAIRPPGGHRDRPDRGRRNPTTPDDDAERDAEQGWEFPGWYGPTRGAASGGGDAALLGEDDPRTDGIGGDETGWDWPSI